MQTALSLVADQPHKKGTSCRQWGSSAQKGHRKDFLMGPSPHFLNWKGTLERWSPTFFAPLTGFRYNNFCRTGAGGGGGLNVVVVVVRE